MAHRSSLLIGGLTLALAACGSQQRDAAAVAQPAPPGPAVSSQSAGAGTLPSDLLSVGSQEGRDALYCSALIYHENPDVSDALAPVDEALLRKAQALGFIIGEYGINKLVAEKAVRATQARALSDAYAAQVEKDMKTDTPRILLDDCNKRAAAIPVPE